MDMEKDIFAEYSYGSIALKKIGSTNPDFRLFEAGWLGNPAKREVMKVTGAVFRRAQRGANKAQLCIIVPGTRQTAYVTAREMDEFDEIEASAGITS